MNVKFKEDIQLIDKYLRGDRGAGEKIFGEIYPGLQRFVYGRTKGFVFFSQNDKDDIIADAMVVAVDKLHLYDGTSKFQTFVIGCASNIIKAKIREKSKEASRVLPIEEIINYENLNSFGKDPLEVLIIKEQKEVVLKAINMLSVDYKDILTLRIFNEMPFKQIVEITQKSEDALDSLFRRALKAFKNNINKINNPPTDF